MLIANGRCWVDRHQLGFNRGGQRKHGEDGGRLERVTYNCSPLQEKLGLEFG